MFHFALRNVIGVGVVEVISKRADFLIFSKCVFEGLLEHFRGWSVI